MQRDSGFASQLLMSNETNFWVLLPTLRYSVVASIAVAMLASSCNPSGYQEYELGDETGLTNSRNPALSVRTDIRYYDVVGTRVYGVRRRGDPVSTQHGYWAKCQLFLADSKQVQYFEPRDLALVADDPNFAEPIKFAQQKCLNFGAPPEKIY